MTNELKRGIINTERGREKPSEREITTMKKTSYVCITYIADGQTASTTTHYPTAEKAIAKAEAWREFGTKANAYKVVVDTDLCEMYHYPLD